MILVQVCITFKEVSSFWEGKSSFFKHRSSKFKERSMIFKETLKMGKKGRIKEENANLSKKQGFYSPGGREPFHDRDYRVNFIKNNVFEFLRILLADHETVC